MNWDESCLKPIIEIGTFIGVVCALFYQNKTINQQRKEIKRQKLKDAKTEFLNLFQVVINEYNTYTSTLDGISDTGKRSYKKSFIDYVDLLFRKNSNLKVSFTDILLDNETIKTYSNDPNDLRYFNTSISEHILDGDSGFHESFYKPYLYLIDNSINLLDTFIINDNPTIDFNEKKDLIKYFFSKLNDYEIILVLIYTINPNGFRLKLLIEKYSLLENRIILYPAKNFINHLNESAFG